MDKRQKEDIKRHIATHTVRSAEDRSAISYLESVDEAKLIDAFRAVIKYEA